MINDKYRISEVAKDLNVPMKELVELLEKQFPGEKKRTTALSNEELNFVFETYTQKIRWTAWTAIMRTARNQGAAGKVQTGKGKERTAAEKGTAKAGGKTGGNCG